MGIRTGLRPYVCGTANQVRIYFIRNEDKILYFEIKKDDRLIKQAAANLLIELLSQDDLVAIVCPLPVFDVFVAAVERRSLSGNCSAIQTFFKARTLSEI